MAYPGALFRYGTFSLGVVVASFGSSLIVKAGLGCSPIASLPFVLNLLVPAVTLGTFTFLINAAALAGQAAVLRREFRPAQLLQLPASFLFSMGLDAVLLPRPDGAAPCGVYRAGPGGGPGGNGGRDVPPL